MAHAKSVEDETRDALSALATLFAEDVRLMDDVLAFVEGILTSGSLVIKKKRGLNEGVVYLAASIMTKGCKTFRAIRATALAGCGQDASILLRALFESTVALLYLLRRNSRRRAVLFAAHEDQRKLVLIEETKKTPGQKRFFKKADVEGARAAVHRWSGLVPLDDIKSVRRHWAGPGGLESAARSIGPGWARLYTMMYRYTSAFSHVSDPSKHLFLPKGTDVPALKLLPGGDELDRVIPMACIHLLSMAEQFGARLGLGIEEHVKVLNDRSLALAKHRAVTKAMRARESAATVLW